MKRYDLIVLGGGNAVTLGMRAAKAGKSVAVIEKDRLGGTCPNRGCIPSKLLLGYSEQAWRIRDAERFYIEASLDALDGARMLRETREATLDATDGKIENALPEGLDLYRGAGRFIGKRQLQVGDAQMEAETVVIGTGTRPFRPNIPGLEGTPYWTSDEVFEVDKLPKSLTVVGGGYIGCELASFFAGVGVETTVLVRGDQMLRGSDDEIREVFTKGFSAGIDVRFGTSLTEVAHGAEGFQLGLEGPDGASQHRSEALLIAAGRIPNQEIGLDAAGVDTDKRGYVVVDQRLRSSAEGVYALGDIKGRHFFTHAAAFEATYLGNCLLDGHDENLDYGPMPHAVFTHPEIAGVGATEAELKEEGRSYKATALPYTSAAKGRAIKEQHGLCKILLSPEGEILGCHIIGAESSVLLHQVLMAMKWRNHISSLTDIIYIHPSLPEVLRNTARRAEASLAD